MAYYRVHSKARRQKVALEGSLNGASAFLIGSNPAILRTNKCLLNMPGVITMAINNAAIVYEPNYFICLDEPQCFNNNIFYNPRIVKFINSCWAHRTINDTKLCLLPNTYFFDVDGTLTIADFCVPEGPLAYYKNTFLTAIHCLYQLGIKNIYLLGCVFDFGNEHYAYEHQLSDKAKAQSASTYEQSVEFLKHLVPNMADEGVHIHTVHKTTNLDGICKYVPFNEAISKVVRETSAPTANEFMHCGDYE